MKLANSASRVVFDWLVNHIRTNHLKSGDLLPKELELCEKLRVSRSSVREAIALLKAFGLVRSQTSVGLKLVADPRQLDLISLFLHNEVTYDNLREVKQLRDFIEIGSAHLMIRNVTDEDISAFYALIDEVRPENNRMSQLDFEVSFHEKLAQLSENNIAVALSLIYKPLFKAHIENTPRLRNSKSIPEYIVDNHIKVVEALEKRDFDMLYTELRKQSIHTEFVADKELILN